MRAGRSSPLGWAALTAGALLATGCARSAHYDVDLGRAAQGEIGVTVRIRGAIGDSLVLRGYDATSAMRLSAVAVRAPGSAGFRVDSMRAAGAVVPRVVIRGPLPQQIEVSWRVVPGAREGDAHVGFTGRSFGEASAHSAFVAGRDLFLVPAELSPSRVRVRFRKPTGWLVLPSWERTDDGWRPGVGRRGQIADLVQSPVAAGAFRVRTIRAGGTSVRCAFDERIAPADEQQAAAALDSVIDYVRETVGRDLGHAYSIVVLGENADGDEIAGTGSATGQGGTLVPLTAERLHAFAARLVDAWIALPPNRVAPAGASERWVLQGLRDVLPWRAVARAGLADDAQIARDFAVDYAEAVTLDDAPRLETLDPSDDASQRLSGVALLALERELERAGGGVDVTLEALARHVLGGAAGGFPPGLRARSLWNAAPKWNEALRTFHSRNVRGATPLSVERFFEWAHTKPEPSPARGTVERTIAFAFTGNTGGYLENCGCKVSQAGGVARRATALAKLRAAGAPFLLLDAGSAFPENRRELPDDALARGEQQLYLETLRVMGYDAVAVGANELAHGAASFRDVARASALPWVIANAGGDQPLALPWQVVPVGGVRVAVIGVFDPPRGDERDRGYERAATGVPIRDPVDVVAQQLPRMRARADLVVVLGRLEPGTIRRLIERCPDLDVVVSSDDRWVGRTPAEEADAGEFPGFDEGESPGFVGRTLVLYATLESFGLGHAVLGLDHERRIATASIGATWLDTTVPEDPAMRGRLTAFYARAGTSPEAIAGVHGPFEADAYRQEGEYVGGTRCATCHAPEAAQWRTTGHAHAWKTLLDVHRHFQPRCVSCHVVQFGAPSGFRMGAPDTARVNVQCEVCHGPGAAHAAAPAKDNIRRMVPKDVCLSCHTPDHSDHFVYGERLPRVMHVQSSR